MSRDIFKQVNDFLWEIPVSFKPEMKVPVWVFANKKILAEIEEAPIEQIVNVASLPGILEKAIIMSDVHSGYGFPIGGVAAFDTEEGIISPGGIGFDINCGIRLMMTDLKEEEIKEKIPLLVDEFFKEVPTGLGREGIVKVKRSEFGKICEEGVNWCVRNGFGEESDLDAIEDGGRLEGADFKAVSEKAIERGISQVGSLGSGNHFLEIEAVEEIFDKEKAADYGIYEKGQVGVAIHTGSRGFGHQIGTDYLKLFSSVMGKYKIKVLDRELSCAPFKSNEGQRYFRAMKAGANNAYVNREVIGDKVRRIIRRVISEKTRCYLLADVCHNIAKLEDYKGKKVLVHRKGATRSKKGTLTVVGGSMEDGSYLLEGTKKAEEISFSSMAHGAGRRMSRTRAKKKVWGERLAKDLKKRGVYIRTASFSGLAEEAGFAYKKVSEVVEATVGAGLARKVIKLRPLGNIKG